jgi:hypothetical protein
MKTFCKVALFSLVLSAFCSFDVHAQTNLQQSAFFPTVSQPQTAQAPALSLPKHLVLNNPLSPSPLRIQHPGVTSNSTCGGTAPNGQPQGGCGGGMGAAFGLLLFSLPSLAITLPLLIGNAIAIAHLSAKARMTWGIIGITLGSLGLLASGLGFALFVTSGINDALVALPSLIFAASIAMFVMAAWNIYQGLRGRGANQIAQLQIVPTFAIGQQGEFQGGFALSGRF